MLQLMGHDYFETNFKPGILAYSVYTLLALFLFTNLYTILYYEPFTVLNASIFMCMAVVVSVIHIVSNRINSA